MTGRRVDHTYVKERLLPQAVHDELRWLPLKDRIVTCELVVRYLMDRTVDPLTRDILACLPEDADRAVDITQVGRAVRLPLNGIGARVVASILYVLTQVNYVRVTTNGNAQRFWRLRPLDDLVGRASSKPWYHDLRRPPMHFVPRSRQLSHWIPGTLAAGLSGFFDEGCWAPDRWWQPPDEDALYTAPRLLEAIIVACRANLHLFQVDSDSGDAAHPRIEALQRSTLMFANFQPHNILRATLIQEEQSYYVVHRCYLSRSGSGSAEKWTVHILRLDTDQEEPGYTRYMRELIAQQPGTIQSLIKTSEPLTNQWC